MLDRENMSSGLQQPLSPAETVLPSSARQGGAVPVPKSFFFLPSPSPYPATKMAASRYGCYHCRLPRKPTRGRNITSGARASRASAGGPELLCWQAMGSPSPSAVCFHFKERASPYFSFLRRPPASLSHSHRISSSQLSRELTAFGCYNVVYSFPHDKSEVSL